MHGAFKEVVIHPVLKRTSLDAEVSENYFCTTNVLFLAKVLVHVVSGQLQIFFEGTDCLDPFQSGFKPGFGIKIVLVTLTDDLFQSNDRGQQSCRSLVDLCDF